MLSGSPAILAAFIHKSLQPRIREILIFHVCAFDDLPNAFSASPNPNIIATLET